MPKTQLPHGMPVMRPVPIPTKGLSGWKQVKVWLFEPRRWELVEDFYIDIRSGARIIIPKGFSMDGASIPRPLWPLLSPTGLLLIPGLVHDYAYKHDKLSVVIDDVLSPYLQGAGKSAWDKIFMETGMDINGMPTLDRAAWLALKIGGGPSWRTHRRAEKEVPRGGKTEG